MPLKTTTARPCRAPTLLDLALRDQCIMLAVIQSWRVTARLWLARDHCLRLQDPKSCRGIIQSFEKLIMILIANVNRLRRLSQALNHGTLLESLPNQRTQHQERTGARQNHKLPILIVRHNQRPSQLWARSRGIMLETLLSRPFPHQEYRGASKAHELP